MADGYSMNCIDLSDKIRKGQAVVKDGVSQWNACYLCLESIDGRMKSIQVKESIQGIESLARYALHPRCYDRIL